MNSKEIVIAEMDEPLTPKRLAETVGVRISVVTVLIKKGILEASDDHSEEPSLSHHSVIKLRRMMRLRRDLGVNFTGADIILEMVEEMRTVRRQLAEIQKSDEIT